MDVKDYGRSFVTFVTPGRENNARLQVESVCSLYGGKAGKTTDYVFFASCKSEDTFPEKNLFYEDNYDFCGIFSDEEFVIFRSRSTHTDGFREEGLWRDRFADIRFNLVEVEGEGLGTNRQIVQASLDCVPLIGRVELEEGSFKAVLEFPIKTMNANDIEDIYQVDTGPMPFPDFGADADLHIKRLSPAYVAYNAPGFADFVVQQPVPVVVGDAEVAAVNHYSNPVSLKAKTMVIAVR
jgi:hypothetical protein